VKPRRPYLVTLELVGAEPRLYPKARLLAQSEALLTKHELPLIVPRGVFIPAIDLPANRALVPAAIRELGLDPPLLLRSCAEREDSTGALSGILESRIVETVTLVDRVLRLMVAEAADVDAGTPGVLVQELNPVERGAVVGCHLIAGRVTAARMEAAERVVPVECATSYTLEFESLVSSVCAVLVAGPDDDELLELATVAIELAEVIGATLDVDDAVVELELAITPAGRFLLLQVRIDEERPSSGLVAPRGERNFGNDRNYVVPVSHLTGALVAPVFTETFGARVRMDDSHQLVTDADRLPTPHLARMARRAGRRHPMRLETVLEAERFHTDWWHQLAYGRERIRQLPRTTRVPAAVANLREQLRTYFTNPLWHACLDVAWSSPEMPAELVGPFSAELRSHRAVRVHASLSNDTESAAGIAFDDLVDVALVGDDEVLTPTVLDDISANAAAVRALHSEFGTTPAEVLEHALGYRSVGNEAARFLERMRTQLDLARDLEPVALAHWYQEADNRFKEIAYLTMREAATAVADQHDLSTDDVGLLTPDELAALAAGALPIAAAAAAIRRRRAVAPAVLARPVRATEPLILVKGSVDALPIHGVVVHADAPTPLGHRPRIICLPGLSARGVRRLPPAEVVVVGHLGLLSHGANGLRAVPGVDLAVAGWCPETFPSPGAPLAVIVAEGAIAIRGSDS